MGVPAGDLRALPKGGTKGQAADPGRVLRQHGLSPQVCHPAAERTAAGKAAAVAAARAGRATVRKRWPLPKDQTDKPLWIRLEGIHLLWSV
jgi:hypothetical protein